jgi:Rrf2 family protein
MVMLAEQNGEALPAGEIAARLEGSEAHLSKVLQRLTHAGLVKSTRGPGGGFVLAKPAKRVTLLDVYTSLEGPLSARDCLWDQRVCAGQCLLGGLIAWVNKEVGGYLQRTRLSDLIGTYGGKHAHPKDH